MKNKIEWDGGSLKGPERAHARAVYKSMGYDDEDLKKPMIGIGNTWSELCPGHHHLRLIAEAMPHCRDIPVLFPLRERGYIRNGAGRTHEIAYG